MNCHLLVRKGSRSGTFEIAKLLGSYEEQKPVRWIRVYNLQDHVFFSHAQHVGPGQIECRECHGEVEKTDRIRLENNLTMGWCIDCHRTRNPGFQSNRFYAEYRELNDRLKRGEISEISVEQTGGTECMKCHY